MDGRVFLLLLLTLLVLTPPSLALMCHKCGTVVGRNTTNWEPCPEDYLNDGILNGAILEYCHVDYCAWFSWGDGKSISSCGSGDFTEKEHGEDETCRDDFRVHNTQIYGRLCTCTSDMCNGANVLVAPSIIGTTIMYGTFYFM